DRLDRALDGVPLEVAHVVALVAAREEDDLRAAHGLRNRRVARVLRALYDERFHGVNTPHLVYVIVIAVCTARAEHDHVHLRRARVATAHLVNHALDALGHVRPAAAEV